MTLNIPPEWKTEEIVELHFDPSCEAMIFDESGLALQGITGGNDDNRRVEYMIPKSEVSAGTCVRYIEVSANGMFGMQPDEYCKENKYFTLETAEILVVNGEARQLSFDFDTLRQLSQTLPSHSPLGNRARATANEIMNTFKGTLDSVHICRNIAKRVLGQGWGANHTGPERAEAVDENGTLWAIGYCHIDTAWLWPWSSTQQKIARSWTSQLDLMERYPEYRFMATAAQHFKWLEDLYPQVFSKLQDKIKSGQFEVNGGCWVEMDCVMPSGESLCRQFLYGQNYFQTRFGKRSDVLVLPDTFGFGPQLPQIARLAGCHSFFTYKLCYSRVNTFPLTSFNWIGLDGSQLLSHLTPIGRYNSICTIDEITRAYPNHKNLDVTADAVIAFGHGDGGGGPTTLQLERLRRARAVGLKSRGQSEEMPVVKQGSSLSDFYDHLRRTTGEGSKLPTWNGELYLEATRGCLTSQSNTKRSFRKSEVLLREVELFSTLASIHIGFSYPKERLDKAWETLCLCMFHDTLPGSSIRLAVEDYDKAFHKILSAAVEMRNSAVKAMQSPHRAPSGSAFLNTLPGLPRREYVQLQSGDIQLVEAKAGDLAGKVSVGDPDCGVSVEWSKDGFCLANASLSITLKHGRIHSIFDKLLNRELLAKGATAGFTLFQDETWDGEFGDAWEIEQYELDTAERLNFSGCKAVLSGPSRTTIECALKFGRTLGIVQITLDSITASAHASSRSLIRFDCHFEWHERHKLLKFELPLALFSDFATFDAAFGVQRRPTTRNTSWEAAKFEVAAHKFADYSEYGYGVALINDCKFGYSSQGNTLGLSLFRGPVNPDEEADQGPHEVSFGVLPHTGTYTESDVQAVAHTFNNPLQVITHALSTEFSSMPIKLDGPPNVLLETIKRGEADFDPLTYVEKRALERTIIIRMYEHMGGRAHVKLVIGDIQVSKAYYVSVLEDNMEELDVVTGTEGDTIDLEFRGFEIKTVKLVLS